VDLKARVSLFGNRETAYLGQAFKLLWLIDKKCFSWLVCPLMSMLKDTMQGLFDLIEGMLRIDSRLLDTESRVGNVTYNSWSALRNVGNVILVIMFIAVIVSQVSGFGIDNYGIKKMLPRLIIIGILMNLSFIVCQLAVDVSNVVGSNIYRFLQSLANEAGFVTSGGAETALGAALVAIIAGFAIAIVVSGGMILIPLLLGLLGGVISVLFMFLLLGVRQVAVIVFVIMAPVAFAMNILPNTQGLFKKWLNIFKVLLLLYPICGLVMGAGYYGALLMNDINDGSGMALGAIFSFVSLILLVAPIFFIPNSI